MGGGHSEEDNYRFNTHLALTLKNQHLTDKILYLFYIKMDKNGWNKKKILRILENITYSRIIKIMANHDIYIFVTVN